MTVQARVPLPIATSLGASRSGDCAELIRVSHVGHILPPNFLILTQYEVHPFFRGIVRANIHRYPARMNPNRAVRLCAGTKEPGKDRAISL